MAPQLPTYATPADLAAAPWRVNLTPESAEQLLGYANRMVRRATWNAIYDADDTTGLPTDADLAGALRDAVCTQVVTWLALEVDPSARDAKAAQVVASKAFGSGSIQYVNYASTVEARARAARNLSPDCLTILQGAGLLADGPVVYG